MVELQDKIQRLQEEVQLKDAELEVLHAAAKDKVCVLKILYHIA